MRWLFTTPLPIDRDRIVAAIQAAEARTSGEIRVVLARHRTRDPIVAAQHHFVRLGMTATKDRNGVLIFVAPRSRNFAVIGDVSVHEKCGDGFWTELAQAMETHFKAGTFTEGLIEAIAKAGTLLSAHFPRRADDANQLPDAIEEV